MTPHEFLGCNSININDSAFAQVILLIVCKENELGVILSWWFIMNVRKIHIFIIKMSEVVQVKHFTSSDDCLV